MTECLRGFRAARMEVSPAFLGEGRQDHALVSDIWLALYQAQRSSVDMSAVIDGWVIPSITARSVIRRGPPRSKVASVDAAVRLIFRVVLRTATAVSSVRASAARLIFSFCLHCGHERFVHCVHLLPGFP